MMRFVVVQSPTPPTPPTPPELPSQTGAAVVTPRLLSGAPLTAQEVSALLARRKMLSDQVTSATMRRREVAKQLRLATGADKAGLEQRLNVLDARIARLEADIDETGRQLSVPSVALKAQQQQPILGWGYGSNTGVSANAAPLLALLILFVLFPIALSVARTLWKRGSRPAPAAPAETAQRLERMEQAIDAVAIEVERISEGQRFVTRLLSEGGTVISPEQAGDRTKVLAAPQPGRTPV